jgi:hypothetical protein
MILLRGGLMAKLKGLVSAVSELRVERQNLVSELGHVDAALSVLGKLNSGSFHTKPKRVLSNAARRKMSLAAKPKRTMSAATRRKIAAAQRARWAKVNARKDAA